MDGGLGLQWRILNDSENVSRQTKVSTHRLYIGYAPGISQVQPLWDKKPQKGGICIHNFIEFHLP